MTNAQVSAQPSAPAGRMARAWLAVRRWLSNPWYIALIYLVGLTIAEMVTTLSNAQNGLVLHGIVLLALFLHASFWDQGRLRGFLLSMALAPLIRLLSLSLPLPHFPFVYWYMIVGAPLLLAAFVAARIGKITWRMQGFTIRKLPVQILIALTGIGLGYLEYVILRPAPLVAELNIALIWLPALILLIFTGFLEEWIFRGLMQYTSMRSFGQAGFFYVAAVFAVLHVGYRSVMDVLFVFAVALLFGWFVRRTGSISGVTMAHGLTNIGLFLIFPFLAAAPVPVTEPAAPGVVQATLTPPAAQPAPGLLAPVVTMESTRPWIPPTATPAAPTSTPEPTLTFTPEPTLTETGATMPPAATLCAPPVGWVAYRIHPGDTLANIGRRVGWTADGLRQANCLTSDTIFAGSYLYVPFLPPAIQPTRAWTATLTPILPTALPTNTAAPTGAPQITPTTAPTATPAPTETPLPTAAPTQAPTGAPTQAPTGAPTGAPTEAPTAPPVKPTAVPPTGQPTEPPDEVQPKGTPEA